MYQLTVVESAYRLLMRLLHLLSHYHWQCGTTHAALDAPHSHLQVSCACRSLPLQRPNCWLACFSLLVPLGWSPLSHAVVSQIHCSDSVNGAKVAGIPMK